MDRLDKLIEELNFEGRFESMVIPDPLMSGLGVSVSLECFPEIAEKGLIQYFLDKTNYTIEEHNRWIKYREHHPDHNYECYHCFTEFIENEEEILRSLKWKPIKRCRKWVKATKEKYNKCTACLSEKQLHAHHIDPYKGNLPENGTILCKGCHEKYHSEYDHIDINQETLNEFIERKQD